MGRTGDGVLREAEEKRIEWKIENFLELSDKSDTRYESPVFSYCGTSWELWIYPNGYYSNTVGWIDLHIAANSLTVPITLDYSLYFKTVDGKADASAGFTDTGTVDRYARYTGRDRFIKRSKLIERKSELLPSGILTVICILKKKGDINGIAGVESVDEFTQTEDRTAGVRELQQQFKEILENGNVSDVVLKVEDQEFKSHRCVLAARAPVFLTMMTQEMKEKNTGVVDIKDVEPKTFSDFLCYLYTGNDEIITPESVVKLFTAADKYQIDELKKSCLHYMLTHISVDNFCDVFSLSLIHVEKGLTDACSQFFVENSLAIVKTPKWLMFMKENPVASNELYIKHVENSMKIIATLQTQDKA